MIAVATRVLPAPLDTPATINLGILVSYCCFNSTVIEGPMIRVLLVRNLT
jgi:hypothetical protein